MFLKLLLVKFLLKAAVQLKHMVVLEKVVISRHSKFGFWVDALDSIFSSCVAKPIIWLKH